MFLWETYLTLFLLGEKSTLKVTFLLPCLGAVLCVWTGCCTCLEDTIPEAIQIRLVSSKIMVWNSFLLSRFESQISKVQLILLHSS